MKARFSQQPLFDSRDIAKWWLLLRTRWSYQSCSLRTASHVPAEELKYSKARACPSSPPGRPPINCLPRSLSLRPSDPSWGASLVKIARIPSLRVIPVCERMSRVEGMSIVSEGCRTSRVILFMFIFSPHPWGLQGRRFVLLCWRALHWLHRTAGRRSKPLQPVKYAFTPTLVCNM